MQEVASNVAQDNDDSKTTTTTLAQDNSSEGDPAEAWEATWWEQQETLASELSISFDDWQRIVSLLSERPPISTEVGAATDLSDEAISARSNASSHASNLEQTVRAELASIAVSQAEEEGDNESVGTSRSVAGGESTATPLAVPMPIPAKFRKETKLALALDRRQLPAAASACLSDAPARSPAATPAGLVAASATSDIIEPSEPLAPDDYHEEYTRMMRRDYQNRFVEPGLESLYRSYKISLWKDKFRAWCLLGAMVAAAGIANVGLDTHVFLLFGAQEHVMLAPFITFLVASLSCWLAMPRLPQSWLLYFYARQQFVLLCLVAMLGGFMSTLGWVFLKSAVVSQTQDPYAQGHWNALVVTTCLVYMAWSDLSPWLFAVGSVIILPLVTLRNASVRVIDGREGSQGLSALSSAGYWACVCHYASMLILGTFVSFHKDKLLRQNFVIFQLVKHNKDRRIQALRGEKKHLEILVDVAEEKAAIRGGVQAVAQPTHIKFVEVNADRTEARRVEPRARHYRCLPTRKAMGTRTSAKGATVPSLRRVVSEGDSVSRPATCDMEGTCTDELSSYSKSAPVREIREDLARAYVSEKHRPRRLQAPSDLRRR